MNLAKALMISIQLLKKENTDEALLFLQPYESECVNLASEILRGGTDCWAVYYAEQEERLQAQEARDNCLQDLKGAAAEREASQTSGAENENSPQALERRISRNIRACEARANSGIVSQGQKLAGLIALRKKRSLFFCLPFAKYKSAFDKKVCSEAQRPLMEFFESREPFCINGEAAGAVFLRNILKNKKTPMRPSVTNKYFLMVSAEENESCPQALERRISRNVRATFRFAIGSLSNCALASAGNRDQARANSGSLAIDQNSGEEKQEASHAQDAGGGSGAAGGLRVVQATAADYERLLPLELGYQREEVVPASFDISDAALAAAFKHELGQGLTFALYDGDRPIAKARVSACGLRHCMLGGVYTIPCERKKGRASFLVRQIISLFESGLDGQRQTAAGQNCSQGLNAGGGSNAFGCPRDFGSPNAFCLYAKQENAAALALYKSLGFKARGEYLLVYY